MGKLKMLRMYNAGDVPDELFQQVCDFVDKLAQKFGEIDADVDPNIILSAFNRFHAGMIVAMISDHDLKNAAQTEAIGLMKNVEHMCGRKLFTDEN